MICYHGTTAENAESIRREGFRVGTWFAMKREDSLAVGGPVILAVELDERKLSDDVDWQFHTLEPIPASAIVG